MSVVAWQPALPELDHLDPNVFLPKLTDPNSCRFHARKSPPGKRPVRPKLLQLKHIIAIFEYSCILTKFAIEFPTSHLKNPPWNQLFNPA